MPDGSADERQVRSSPQVTLRHLLLGIAFVEPVIAVFGDLRRAGGGALQYVAGVPLALALGTAIVWLTWKSGKAIWLHFGGRSETAKRAIAIGLFVADICAVIAGLLGGSALASLLIKLSA